MQAKKSFGQHFLQDKSVIKKIIAAAEIVPGETILEIGPGHGVLTQALVDAGARVLAVEADRDLIPELKEKFEESIELIQGDVLRLFGSRPFRLTDYKLVSNLPYNIASAVLERFLSAEHPPTRLVVMVQKEVADRILAKPGDMSVLSVACQLYADVKRVCNVPPGAFRPMPKVESSVVRLDIKPRTEAKEPIIALAKLGFSSRRKQLKGNLAKKYGAHAVKGALLQLGISEKARAQELSTQQWIALWKTLQKESL